MSSIIYRELLLSILNSGKSKAYHYGIEYLKESDNMSPFIKK